MSDKILDHHDSNNNGCQTIDRTIKKVKTRIVLNVITRHSNEGDRQCSCELGS